MNSPTCLIELAAPHVAELALTQSPCASSHTNVPRAHWPSFDKTTKAALAFVTTSQDAVLKDEIEHLTAIVLKACRGLYLQEAGTSPYEATHCFIRFWLLQKLLPYRHGGDAFEAADRGEFRYLGSQGRSALIDEIRKRTHSKDALDQRVVSMDEPCCDDDGDEVDPRELWGTNSFDGPVCPIGRRPSLEPSVLKNVVAQGRDEIAETLGDRSSSVLSTICDLFPDNVTPGNVTRAVAAQFDVSEQTARKFHRELASKLQDLTRSPVIRAIVELITTVGEPVSVRADRSHAIACG